MFHYGFVHAVLVDWAGHRQASGLANALVETVSVLDGGELPVEERLRLVEAAAERARESGVRTAAESDGITALRSMDRLGLLTPTQTERLKAAAQELARADEI